MNTRAARFGLVAILSLTLGATGCSVLLSSHKPGSRLHVELPKAPPAPRSEKSPAKTKPGQFWVKGYWDFDSGSQTFRWRAGHQVAYRSGRRYVQARYEQRQGKWFLVLPHWRHLKQRQARPAPGTTPQPGGTSTDTGATAN